MIKVTIRLKFSSFINFWLHTTWLIRSVFSSIDVILNFIFTITYVFPLLDYLHTIASIWAFECLFVEISVILSRLDIILLPSIIWSLKVFYSILSFEFSFIGFSSSELNWFIYFTPSLNICFGVELIFKAIVSIGSILFSSLN
jgi:hypothetical protein